MYTRCGKMTNRIATLIVMLHLGLVMVGCLTTNSSNENDDDDDDDDSLKLLAVAAANETGGYTTRNITSCSLDSTPLSRLKNSSSVLVNSSTASDENDDCFCPRNKVCVRKCCPLNHVFASNGTHECVPAPSASEAASSANVTDVQGSHLHFLHFVARTEFKAWSNLSGFENVHFIHGVPCKSTYRLEPHTSADDAYLLMENGSLISQNVSESRYCVEYVANERQILPHLCADDEKVDTSSESQSPRTSFKELDRYLKIRGFSLSVVLLLVTFLVYAIVPSLHQTLQGKNLLCHVSSLIIGYSSLLIVSCFHIHLSDSFCIISALVVQFTFLASFFWLNVMCFDLWFAFSGYRSFNGSPKERDLKKFLVYCLYAWGCPALIVAATIFAEFYPYLPRNFIRPGFGKHKCYFDTTKAEFIYFYGFVSLIVFSNLFMFISTAFILKKHKKEAKVFKRSGSRRHLHHHNESFNLYLKLFIVMGANWMMEVMSFYLPLPNEIWLVSDLLNASQGVLIFVIFVLKRRIFNLVKKRLLPHRPFVGGSRSKKTSFNTVTSVISLASVRGGAGAGTGTSGGVVSPKSPPVQSAAATADQLEVEVAC